MKSLKTLIIELEISMDEYWTAIANCEPPNDDVYMLAQEIEEQGIGAVCIPTMHGSLRWFDLHNMEF